MAWKRWVRWAVLVGVLAVTFGRWCLRAIAMGDAPISRLTLVPRYREPEEGREAPGPAALAALERAVSEQPRERGRHASSPDLIQPRDLRIRVSAPEGARSVSITLPSGETRSARYDPERGIWTVRFFAGKETPEGIHDVGVRIVGEDGHAEALWLPYAVKTQAPAVSVSLRLVAGDRDELDTTARAIVAAEGRTATGIAASVVEDARHVEVLMPDRHLVILRLIGDGVFRGYWRARRIPSGPLRIRVVSVDRALNERVTEVSLTPSPAVTADGSLFLDAARRR